MTLDARLALRAALNGLVFVVPAAIAGAVLADGEGDLAAGPAIGIAAVQILGFTFSGWVVRKLDPGSSTATCAVAGLGCAVLLQAIGIVTSLVRGEGLNPLTWVATALVAAVAGCAGGLLARVERAPTSRSD